VSEQTPQNLERKSGLQSNQRTGRHFILLFAVLFNFFENVEQVSKPCFQNILVVSQQKKQLIHSIVKQFIGALWCFSYFSSTYQFLSGYDFSLLYEAVLSNTFKCFAGSLDIHLNITLALAPHGTLVNIQN